ERPRPRGQAPGQALAREDAGAPLVAFIFQTPYGAWPDARWIQAVRLGPLLSNALLALGRAGIGLSDGTDIAIGSCTAWKGARLALLLRPIDFFILPLSIFADRDLTRFAGDFAASVRGARGRAVRGMFYSVSRFPDFADVCFDYSFLRIGARVLQFAANRLSLASRAAADGFIHLLRFLIHELGRHWRLR